MREVDRMYFDKYAIDPVGELFSFDFSEEEWCDNEKSDGFESTGLYEDGWSELE